MNGELFIRKVRPGSHESFVCLADDAPEWALEMVREAHGDEFPDDWRYETCADIVSFIVEAGEFATDLSDAGWEIAERLVPVYTSDRLAWLASNLNRVSLVDEFAEEYGWSAQGLAETIGGAMHVEIAGMVPTIIESMSDAYDEYVAECDAEGCEAHTVAGWFVHGFPTGPLG